MTLQDYIKLADDLKMKADIMTMGERIAWGSDTALMYQASEVIPAMAKALIEAEEALKYARKELWDELHASMSESDFNKQVAPEIYKALATIQALQENKNEQR